MAGKLIAALLVTIVIQLTCGQHVYLTLGSTNITTNNSEVLIRDIGQDVDGGRPSLTCHTDLTECCRRGDTGGQEGLGAWYYPNGSALLNNAGSMAAREQFYFVRNAPQLIRLASRTSYKPLTPTGSYCCVIPTTGGKMTFCANIVLCLSLPPLTNGIISYSDPTLNLGSVATHSCDILFALEGSSTRTCQYDGTWNGLPPTCIPASCEPLTDPTNGEVTYKRTTKGITATYSCNTGYKLIGEDDNVCQENGMWSSSKPKCAAICPALPNPRNEIIMYNSINHTHLEGDVATYSCDEGSLLIGKEIRVCQLDGSWSHDPYCIDQAVVQLQFGLTSHCLEWSMQKALTVSSYLREVIHQVIQDGGQDIPLVNIDEGVFSCRTSQTHTTYRTVMNGTREASAVRAAADLQKWVESGPVVRVEWYLVDISRSCPVAIDSLTEEECIEDQCVEGCVAVCRARG